MLGTVGTTNTPSGFALGVGGCLLFVLRLMLFVVVFIGRYRGEGRGSLFA